MGQHQPCSGCYALAIKDPKDRAHKLLDLHVASGGYDYWHYLVDAINQAAANELANIRSGPAEVQK